MSQRTNTDSLTCPYCGKTGIAAVEGERRAMRAHHYPRTMDRCPASGLTVEEAQFTRPAEDALQEILAEQAAALAMEEYDDE